jgi:hypothetical protein
LSDDIVAKGNRLRRNESVLMAPVPFKLDLQLFLRVSLLRSALLQNIELKKCLLLLFMRSSSIHIYKSRCLAYTRLVRPLSYPHPCMCTNLVVRAYALLVLSPSYPHHVLYLSSRIHTPQSYSYVIWLDPERTEWGSKQSARKPPTPILRVNSRGSSRLPALVLWNESP